MAQQPYPVPGKERRKMNIEKAIEILYLSKEPEFEGDSNDFYEAIQLGIEALKSVKQDRVLRLEGRLHPLPGETEE